MSQTEIHFGKLKVLARGNKSVFDYIEKHKEE